MAVLVAALALALPCRSAAAERVEGKVAGVAAGGVVTIRHDAFGGMPAMTMLFRLPKGVVVRVGDVVTGTVDRRTEPWSLFGVRVRHRARNAGASSRRALSVNGLVPDVLFSDQRARPFALSSLRGRRYALSFVYTRCQDARMCPLVSAKYRQVQNDRRAPAADLVEVTLDPGFDTPSVLGRYGRTFGADPERWHLLTGDPAAVLAFAETFGVRERREENLIVHAERTVIVGADGRIERFIDDPAWTAADLVAALDRKDSAWLRFARASRRTFAWCGEAVGANGRTALHHLAVVLMPIGFLGGLVGLGAWLERR